MTVSEHETTTEHAGEPTRRDFLYMVTGMAGVVGAASVAWPFIDQMRPDASTLALASIEVDVSAIEPGMSLTVKWRGKPVMIRHRDEDEIAIEEAVTLGELRDAALAEDCYIKPEWVIVLGICTHLGCVPLNNAGEYHGWFCPCHGSHYDTCGRIRKGPAPLNLEIPPYKFIDEAKVLIG